MHPLDNPVWHALNGPHRRFAEPATTVARARRYPADVAFFAATDTLDAAALDALATFAAGQAVVIARLAVPPIAGPVVERMRRVGHQYVLPADVALSDAPDGGRVERLTPDDVRAMLALTRAAEPGPFLRRTIELGDYYGVRDGDRLVAMAGERFHLDGWCEISAVCTDASARRRGLGATVTAAVARGIRARGETPVLHVVKGNDAACALYESMGFERRTDLDFVALSAPAESVVA